MGFWIPYYDRRLPASLLISKIVLMLFIMVKDSACAKLLIAVAGSIHRAVSFHKHSQPILV